MGTYDDILNLERPVSSHPSMPREERAKQFMPFASLRGFDDVIDDRGTLRDRRMELSEDERETLDERIRRITKQLSVGSCPRVTLRLFTPDTDKGTKWGFYCDVTGQAEKFRPVEREIRIDGQWYPIDMADGVEIL